MARTKPAKWNDAQSLAVLAYVQEYMAAPQDDREEVVEKALSDLKRLPLEDLARFTSDTDKAMVFGFSCVVTTGC